LAATIALYTSSSLETSESINRAEKYLWHNLHRLARDPFELVGFELILPTLLHEARKYGIDVPTHTCGYGKIQTEKLKLVPLEYLYSPKISTVHSLEFLGKDADLAKLKRAKTINGSLGNSPSATAYYLDLCNSEDRDALKYLQSIKEHTDHIIYLFPFRTFELAWVLNNLIFSGKKLQHFIDGTSIQKLNRDLTNQGAGLDPSFGIPDADTTSVTLYILSQAGQEIDYSILKQFENPNKRIFKTYQFERNPSVSTNAHALDILNLLPDYPDREIVREKILIMLLNSRRHNMYWTDKWHASPYYATAHAIISILRAKKETESFLTRACAHTLDWIVHTQHSNGSWGFFNNGTAEETAYALMTLIHYYKQDNNISLDILKRGVRYLLESTKCKSSYPELWLGKDLYTPIDVVRSSILSTLILYEDTFGNLP
jgi:halimadienyl-diphosphate synthase